MPTHKRIYQSQVILEPDFNKLREKLQTQFTITYKSICKALKCTRSWADEYIKPFVPFIFVSSGYGSGGIKTNWLFKLSSKDKKMKDSLYFDEKAFQRYIIKHAKATKRAKTIYLSDYIDENLYSEFIMQYISLLRKKDTGLKSFDLENFKNFFSNEVFEKIVKNQVFSTKRTEAKWCDCELPKVPINEWIALHDIMDYGDVAEMHYRNFFKKGMIKVELKLPNRKGQFGVCKKIYYIKDPNLKEPMLDYEKVDEIICQAIKINPNNEAEQKQKDRYIHSFLNFNEITIQEGCEI